MSEVKEIWYERPKLITAKYGRCVFCKKDVTGQVVNFFKQGFVRNDGLLMLGKDAAGHWGVVICSSCADNAYVVIKDEYNNKLNLIDHEIIYVTLDENAALLKLEQERKYIKNALPWQIQYPTSFQIQKLSSIPKRHFERK